MLLSREWGSSIESYCSNFCQALPTENFEEVPLGRYSTSVFKPKGGSDLPVSLKTLVPSRLPISS